MLTTDLSGKVALVTGAGKGIGRAIAKTLAENGAMVIAVARTQSDLETLEAETKGHIECWAMDVTDKAFFARIESLEKLDIAVNNAGTNRPEPMVDVSTENLDFVLDLNVRSVYLAAQAQARVMIKSGCAGSIIHMSSQMGHVGSPNRTVYCVTKHALEGLTKAMAVELAPHNIRVNAVAPTYVETPLVKPMLADPEFKAFVDRMIPLGRIGDVQDIADACLYLASPAANMVTGQSLKVDGGWTAH